METLLDRRIEKAYYKIANGLVIDIMDIPKVFQNARNAIYQRKGVTVDQAVRAAVLMYCSDEAKLRMKTNQNAK